MNALQQELASKWDGGTKKAVSMIKKPSGPSMHQPLVENPTTGKRPSKRSM